MAYPTAMLTRTTSLRGLCDITGTRFPKTRFSKSGFRQQYNFSSSITSSAIKLINKEFSPSALESSFVRTLKLANFNFGRVTQLSTDKKSAIRSSASSESKIESQSQEMSDLDQEERIASNSSNGAASDKDESLPSGELVYRNLEGWNKFVAQFRMLTALPWRRVKKGSVLSIRLAGSISEKKPPQFSQKIWLKQLCSNLEKASIDPRISGFFLNIDPLDCGWGKIDEIRRYIELFKASGKFTIAYMAVGGEKEFYLASACDEIFAPPVSYINIRGLSVQGQFLRGVLEKVGVEPQIRRIGKYKSAGDQLSRKTMSEANREMLTALLDDICTNWAQVVATSRRKTLEDAEKLLEEGILDAVELKQGGWITDLKYENQIEDLIKERVGSPKDKPVRAVDYRKYSKVNEKMFGLGSGKDKIAIIRASGAISRGRGSSGSSGIKSETVIKQIRKVRENKKIKAVVLRIDSPGGDALASDQMWEELRLLSREKPLVSSMADVAASGGYYMAMAAPTIVAEKLTLTGSIGIIIGKFNLENLYSRIGFNKEIISRGKFAEVLTDQRPFRPEEEEYFTKLAENGYQSFRKRAALSRSMEVEKMEEVAQGRVWTGKQALSNQLVDAIGGLSTALAIAKQKAGIPQDQSVQLVEVSYSKLSLNDLLSSGSLTISLLGLRGLQQQREAINEILSENLFAKDIQSFANGEPLALMELSLFGNKNDPTQTLSPSNLVRMLLSVLSD